MNHIPVGLLRKAFIVEVNEQKGYITAELEFAPKTIAIDRQKRKKVQVPFAFYSGDGMFMGGKPQLGTPIVIGQGEGTQWYFVSFLVSNIPTIPDLEDGELFIQASDASKIILRSDDTLDIGSDLTLLHLNNTSNKFNNKLQQSFSADFSFSEASRNISGMVKREVLVDQTPSYLKLTSEIYDNNLTPIGLDPKSTSFINTNSSNKNPPFIEKKEIIYEFAYSSNVSDDLSEGAIYNNSQQSSPTSQYFLPNRRQSKTDGFSLSLVAPNFLMETIKGTGVDIFGNLLDLNRVPILGYGIQNQSSNLSLNVQANKETAFFNIKAVERKGLVYHFEINARKDLTTSNGQEALPNVNSSANYARPRSRFFFDVDKEGQLKLNVPASSETGNIPLHTRYENYSTFGPEDSGNPNKFIIRDDYLDLFLDSYAIGAITVADQNGSPSTPIDRLAQVHIQHGMPFHNITNSGQLFQSAVGPQFISYQRYLTPINVSAIPTLSQVVSPLITIAGSNANAGGRSGSMNFDGSLEVSLGANTIDRQSLWLDTAGGLIANIGRDTNFASAVVSMDGDLLLQVGGNGVVGDSRFANLNNGYRGGAIDIRVFNEGFSATMIRIDKNGVSIMTPSTLAIYGRDIDICASGTLNLDGDNIYIGSRWVNKLNQGSI
jgi:hypothetical protein